MKPEESSSSQSGVSLSKQGLIANSSNKQPDQKSRDAATQLIRSQIDNLYNNQATDPKSDDTNSKEATPLEDINPYHKTHSKTPSIQTNDWKHYHTAWQNYYQKYYEGYYNHLDKKRQSIEPAENSEIDSNKKDGQQHFTNKNTASNETKKIFSPDEAIFDMRQELIGKVHKSAIKIRKSRHFIPIISGLIVVLIFVFLQYNRLIISNVMAYVSPGNIDPQNIVINPNSELKVGPKPLLIIPKINVNVPVIYDIGNDYTSQMTAMSKGVAHFAIPGASSHPGQIGNTVISGHSSNDLLDSGDYKFIFAQLDKLNVDDTIYLNYKSTRYTYIVTKKSIVKPNNVSSLVYKTNKSILTLITCTPIGTSLNRLLVTAEQTSPDPNKSTKPPTSPNKSTTTSIPGNSPTFIERLFGAR